MQFTVFVVWLWLLANLVALGGAIALGLAALRDMWYALGRTFFYRHKDLEVKKVARVETAGILFRSGTIRTLTTAIFILIDIPALTRPIDKTPVVTGLTAIGLALATAYVTIRDLVARKRISRAVDAQEVS